MHRLNVRILLLISSLLFGSGCAIQEAKRYEKAALTEVSAPQALFERNHSFIYKSSVSIYGERLSGLLAIKEMDDQSYRTILTSYLGLKLFDFEFDNGDFTVHKIMDKMDRPLLIKLIRNDFELLLMENIDPYHLEPLRDPWTGDYVFRWKEGKITRFYFVDEESEKLIRIEEFRKRKKKKIIEIEKYRWKSASKIHLSHLDRPVEIHLNLIK